MASALQDAMQVPLDETVYLLFISRAEKLGVPLPDFKPPVRGGRITEKFKSGPLYMGYSDGFNDSVTRELNFPGDQRLFYRKGEVLGSGIRELCERRQKFSSHHL